MMVMTTKTTTFISKSSIVPGKMSMGCVVTTGVHDATTMSSDVSVCILVSGFCSWPRTLFISRRGCRSSPWKSVDNTIGTAVGLAVDNVVGEAVGPAVDEAVGLAVGDSIRETV
jgi:hypothetical protein